MSIDNEFRNRDNYRNSEDSRFSYYGFSVDVPISGENSSGQYERDSRINDILKGEKDLNVDLPLDDESFSISALAKLQIEK